MGPEREELVKHAFPQLRKMCETRGVTWSEVDLRWGVTEEAVAEDRAAEICLREVDRCHPFFIGILGTHYGPLTAREIERGALDQPAKTLARFYFRAGAGVAAIEELKTRIRESGLTVRDGYRSPQELAEWILNRFRAAHREAVSRRAARQIQRMSSRIPLLSAVRPSMSNGLH